MTLDIFPFVVGGAILLIGLAVWGIFETVDRADEQGVNLWDTFLSNFGMEADEN